MDICSDNHEEICFAGRGAKCPVCPLIQEIEELKAEINYLKKEFDN